MLSVHRSVEVGEEKYTYGDYVLLHGTKRKLICRLTGFVKNTTDGQATAEIEWVYWPEEMVKQLRTVPAKKRPKMPNYLPGDVFLSNTRDSADIESIACKVSVLQLAPVQPAPLRSDGNSQYYARWRWDANTKRFTAVKKNSEQRRGVVGAVMAASTMQPAPPSPKDTAGTPLRAQGNPYTELSPGKVVTRDVSISLSLSPTSPLGKKKNASPKSDPPPSLTPRRDGIRSTRHETRSVPLDPLCHLTTRMPKKIATRPRQKSTHSSRVLSTKKHNVGICSVVHSLTDEQPLPPSSSKTSTIGSREGKKGSPITPKRGGRLNTRDVVDLLGDNDKEDDELAECLSSSSSDEEQQMVMGAKGNKEREVKLDHLKVGQNRAHTRARVTDNAVSKMREQCMGSDGDSSASTRGKEMEVTRRNAAGVRQRKRASQKCDSSSVPIPDDTLSSPICTDSTTCNIASASTRGKETEVTRRKVAGGRRRKHVSEASQKLASGCFFLQEGKNGLGTTICACVEYSVSKIFCFTYCQVYNACI